MNRRFASSKCVESPVVNFGSNVRFNSPHHYSPRSEQELLDLLKHHQGRPIRAVGRLHSWSNAPVCPHVLIDLRHLNSVTVCTSHDSPRVEVGAGCQLKQLLADLERQGDYTIPSLGLITEQTIAGATATGTHGSGRHSLSHYVQAVRLATYSSVTGEPVIRTIDQGEELQAVRCALGCMGVVMSVTLSLRTQYRVEEHFQRYQRLNQVLDAETQFNLQQFFLVPWRWDFFAQHRREVEQPRSQLAPFYRLYWGIGMDILFHWVVCALARGLPARCTKLFFGSIMPRLIPRSWKVIDRSDRQLTMQHQRFRHVEIEMFVTRGRLAEAVTYVVWLLRHLGGETSELDVSLRAQLKASGVWQDVQRQRGSYVHHYPICIRKVLPDDTLISMASGDEVRYALSFISYAHPKRRDDFFRFANLLARTTAILFEARPHWGKLVPLDADEIAALYPRLEKFGEIVDIFDAQGVFGNAWTDSLFRKKAASPLPNSNLDWASRADRQSAAGERADMD